MTSNRPAVALADARLETLELIVGGLLGSVNGYCLPSESPEGWEVRPHLRVEGSLARSALKAGALELRDPDTTPLALLMVDADEPADDGGRWLAGTVIPLRQPEHGPARSQRLTTASDLSGHAVGLFANEINPANVLRLAKNAAGQPLALVAEGSVDTAQSTRVVAVLDECVRELSDASVYFIPHTDLDPHGRNAIARLMLKGVGATRIEDLRRAAKASRDGAVILFTGLSGAGKSTIARAVTEYLRAHTDQKTVLLDGDHVRAELASELTFSAEDRDRNLQRQAWVGARVAEAGGLAICAPIAPFASSRAAMRAKVEPDHPFILVHVSTPIAVAEQRDRKGLYAKARAGLIPDFTGIDSPYEVPDDADLSIDTSALTVDQCVDAVIDLLVREGLL